MTTYISPANNFIKIFIHNNEHYSFEEYLMNKYHPMLNWVSEYLDKDSFRMFNIHLFGFKNEEDAIAFKLKFSL